MREKLQKMEWRKHRLLQTFLHFTLLFKKEDYFKFYWLCSLVTLNFYTSHSETIKLGQSNPSLCGSLNCPCKGMSKFAQFVLGLLFLLFCFILGVRERENLSLFNAKNPSLMQCVTSAVRTWAWKVNIRNKIWSLKSWWKVNIKDWLHSSKFGLNFS